MTIKEELRNLPKHHDANRVLSVFLDVDQSNASNLNSGFVMALRSELKLAENQIQDEVEKELFRLCAARIAEFAAAYTPRARALVLFSSLSGSLWIKELDVTIKTNVVWDRAPYVVPLAQVLDEYRRYAVAIVSRAHARVLTVVLGRIEQRFDLQAEGHIEHVKSTGRDHANSQSGMQRNADQHVHANMKRVVRLLEQISAETPYGGLVLGGSPEVAAALELMFPKWLAHRIVGSASLPLGATDARIIAEIGKLEHMAGKTFALDHVNQLIDAAAQNARATTDPMEALKALNERRVREFVFTDSARLEGVRCDACDAAYPAGTIRCAYCGEGVKTIDNLIPWATTRALENGAGIELLRDEAATKLNEAGGIGAFLRY